MTIFLDAAGTLIRPAAPVGEVYSRQLQHACGHAVAPDRMHTAFLEVFRSAAPPDYSLHPFGHAAEHAWWRELVAAVLTSLGGGPAAFAHAEPDYDAFFESLFAHYADPSAWSLFPEVVDVLRSASRHAPLAVVSNFDDRLEPILNGLGIGPFFEHVFTSADARARKPDSALFHLALDRMNCAPEETFHCGDCPTADFQGATAAGLHAFHLIRPAQSLHHFLDFCTAR